MLLAHILSVTHEEGFLMPNIPAWNFLMQLCKKQKWLIMKLKHLLWVKGTFYYFLSCSFFLSIQCYLDSLH